MAMILSPPPPSAPPLSPDCAYAVFPEDELPEPPVPSSPSIYAVFPEDEITEVPIAQVGVGFELRRI